MKRIILVLLFLFVSPTSVFAATTNPSNVKLEGNAAGLITLPDNRFLEYLDMMPGDTESGIVEIKNSDKKSFDLYLRAQRVSEKQDYDLLEQITLNVTYKDQVIYNGPVSGANGLEKNIYLGTIKPGDQENLVAEIELDGATTTAEYKNQIAQVNWIFTAQREGDPTPPVTPKPIPPTGSVTTPNTGDQSMMVYVLLAAGSGLLLTRKMVLKFKK